MLKYPKQRNADSMMRPIARIRGILLFQILLVCQAAHSQIITTAAGTDFTFPTGNITALNAPVGTVGDVLLDPAGNLYIADSDNNLVLRVSPNGITTVVAGNGIAGYSGDGGPATAASLKYPAAIALDPNGNLYIADALNSLVREVSNGIITTIAGQPYFAGADGDGGPATSASIGYPYGIAIDTADNIYVSDVYNNVVRKITNGIISTVAGKAENPGGFSGDNGPATSAELSEPYGLAFDAAGNLYISDSHNSVIRKVAPGMGGTITTFAGSSGNYGYTGDNGPATAASLGGPMGIRFDSSGNLYIADQGEYVVRKISPSGIITTVAGNNLRGFSGDGTQALRAKIFPIGVAIDPQGDIYIADSSNYRVRKVTGSGVNAIINTYAGNGNFRFGGDGGLATTANINSPQLIAVAPNGDYYIADNLANRIRKVSNGVITTAAGSGAEGFLGDNGPAVNAALDNPNGVAVDAIGNIYIADISNNRIREVSNGVITTIAGTTLSGYNGDGISAVTAELNNPAAVALDPAGNLYIADQSNNRIRKVSNGIITTVVGNGNYGYSGDGGPATSATIQNVSGLAFDAAGNLYFSDFDFQTGNYIRKVSNGIITTIAGIGTPGYSGDGGAATSAQLGYPEGVAVDSAGNVYVADTHNCVIRKISGGIITTFAGTEEAGLAGDGGPATSAMLYLPAGVAVDATGNVYISDTHNSRIREVLANPPFFVDPISTGGLTISLSQASGGKPVTSSATVGATTTASSSSAVPGMQYTATVRSGSAWLSVSPASGNTPGLLTITADPLTLTPGSYSGAIDLAVPSANPPLQTVTVMFTVGPGIPAAVAVDQTHMSFSYSTTSGARSQALIVSNSGGGQLNITASVTLYSGIAANWLSVSPATATATPSTPVSLAVTADPSMLGPGAYTGVVTITGTSNGAPAGSVTVPITMTITANPLVMLLSQAGLTFTAVQNGGVVPPQTFGVLNLGSGVLNWTVQTSTLQGGNWLSATPSTGSTNTASADGAPLVSVSVNAAGLAPGTYYGLVQVISPGAANSPQEVVAVLQVLPAGADLAPIVQPTSLIFTTPPDGSSPSSQNVLVYDPTGTGKSFRSDTTTTANGLVTLPTDATIPSNAPTQIVVQPLTGNLSPGSYTGAVSLQFSDGRVGNVAVGIVVPGGSGSASARPRVFHDNPPCTPTKLIPVLTTLGPGFAIPAGYPEGLTAQIMDDCGNPLTSGQVSIEFSTGEGLKYMQSLNNGRWDVTWQTGSQQSSSVTLTVHAQHPTLPISGSAQIAGSLGAPQPAPQVQDHGVVSAADFVPSVPIAPGGIISIFGSLLSDATGSAAALPLTTALNNTTVRIGDQQLPLFFTSAGQLNAQVPFETPANTNIQLLVQRDNTYATPVYVDVAAAQPAIFQYPLNGQPEAIAVNSSGLIAPSNPAHAGDTLVLYCTGLGAVDQQVADGAASPEANAVNAASISVGGQSVTPVYAGLTPTLVGLYQINFTVPPNTGMGDQIPLVISAAGQTSAAAFISVR